MTYHLTVHTIIMPRRNEQVNQQTNHDVLGTNNDSVLEL